MQINGRITSSRPEVFCKKDVFRNSAKFTGKNLCQSLFFNKLEDVRHFIKKETLVQVFSCEFGEISQIDQIENSVNLNLL